MEVFDSPVREKSKGDPEPIECIQIELEEPMPFHRRRKSGEKARQTPLYKKSQTPVYNKAITARKMKDRMFMENLKTKQQEFYRKKRTPKKPSNVQDGLNTNLINGNLCRQFEMVAKANGTNNDQKQPLTYEQLSNINENFGKDYMRVFFAQEKVSSENVSQYASEMPKTTQKRSVAKKGILKKTFSMQSAESIEKL